VVSPQSLLRTRLVNNLKSFILYSTDGCHLCEEAEVLLKDLQHKALVNFDWYAIDIVNNDRLFELYETTIPVVCHSNSKKELHWPFSTDKLLGFISACLVEVN